MIKDNVTAKSSEVEDHCSSYTLMQQKLKDTIFFPKCWEQQ